MRSQIATIFLSALAGNACAAWTAIDKGESQTAYVDRDTIRRSANTVKMWTLMDFATPRIYENRPSFSSTVALYEFDCPEQRVRVLQGAAYEGQMRAGAQVVSYNTPMEWTYVQPGTVKEAWLKIACETK